MLRILALLAASALALTPAPFARAAPELELDPGWYTIVDPFRYVEARRFERGWNRGADAVTRDELVRAPVDGRVRFAGAIAGRGVLTIDARVDGEPVVVTITGVDSGLDRSWRQGDRVAAGDVLGTGERVQVGMYDPVRRSRYLPVVSARGRQVAGTGAGSLTLSGTVASRLRDAILGEVGAPDASAEVTPGSPPDAAAAMRTLVVPSAGVPAVTSVSPPGVPRRRHVVGLAAGPAQPLEPGGPSQAMRERVVAGATQDPQPSRPRARAATSSWQVVGTTTRFAQQLQPRDRVGLDTGHVVRTTAPAAQWLQPHAAMPEAAGRGAGPSRGGDPVLVASADAMVDDDDGIVAAPERDRTIRTSPIGSPVWTIPTAVAALAVVALLAWRRRRRIAVEEPRAPAPSVPRPRGPLLPTMVPGRSPLAWADHDPGTSTHHERELLRHDADLLPECEPAPGACVHDDRRGRDHPLPAAHGP